MKIEYAKKIAEVGQWNDLQVELRETYGGRGMGGNSTAGVEGQFTAILAAVAHAVADAAIEGEAEAGNLANAMNKVRIDSMGRGVIIY